MINLEWYRTFKAIYRAGTLTKAAQELMISQPNVSVQLAALENYVGSQLFERHPRKMVPTNCGKILYTQIVEAMDTLEKVELSVRRSMLKTVSTLRIGTPHEFFLNYLVNSLPVLDSNLVAQFGLTKDLIAMLSDGSLDFVVATQKINASNLVYEPLMNESFMIVSNANCDTSMIDACIANGSWAEAEELLLNRPWYAYANDLVLIRRFWLENFEKRPMIKAKYIIPDLNAIAKALNFDNNGFSVLSDHFFQVHNKKGNLKVVWEGRKPVLNNLYLVYNKNSMSLEQLVEVKRILPMFN